MNRKIKKLFRDPKSYFYDYFRKKLRSHPSSIVSFVVRTAFSNAKTDLGYGNEVRRLLKAGELDMAEKICQEGMTVVPRSIRPFALYAEVSMRKGDFMEATRRWKVVVERFPNKVEGYAREVRAYIRLNDLDHAEKLCLAGMKRMPSEPWPYSEYAEISMLRREWPEAVFRWAKLRERFPQKIHGYIRAAHAFIEIGNYAYAESLCKDALERFPDDIWSYQVLAEISMRKKEYNEALNRWQNVRERFPNKANGYVRASVAHCELKEYKEADELCRKCMEIVPNDTSPFSEFAEISMRKGDFKEASNRWKIVQDKFPNRPVGYIGGCKVYIELQQYKKAEDLLRKSLKSLNQDQSKYTDIYYLMIDAILNQTKRSKECINIISKIEQIHHGFITDRRYYGVLVKTLFNLLVIDKEEVNCTYTDFILIRLLNEPLYYFNGALGIGLIIFRLIRYQEIIKLLKERIETIIQKEQINSPLSILVSSASSDDERVGAHLKIIRDNCFNSIQLCRYHPQNIIMLERACDEIINSGEWKNLSSIMIFNFVRSVIFANQDKSEQLISKVYEIYKDQNLPISDPIGLLCFRHKKRQELMKSMSNVSRNNRKKLKIAVCIGGQLRGYKGNLQSLVNALGLDRYNYMVFLHTWSNIGRKFPVAVHAARTFDGEFLKAYYECFVNKANLQDYIKNSYPNFYSLLVNSSKASLDVLKKEYKTSNVVIDNEDDEPFLSWGNQEKMHYKIYAAHKLAMDSGEKFDLIIRIRPDSKREGDGLFDLHDILYASRRHGSIFTARGLLNGTITSEFLIDDNFAIGVPEVMDIYAHTFIDFIDHAQKNTYSRTKQYAGHKTIGHNLFCNGVHIDTIPDEMFRGGAAKDPEMISIEDIYIALNKDIKISESTAECMRLIEASKMDIGSTQK